MNTMQRKWKTALSFAFAIIAIQIPATATPWVSAYYTTWTVGSPAPADIDMRPITHLLFFALAPNADGTLTDTDGGITANATAVKTVAHNAGKKVLICIGGGGTAANFRGAISSAHRAAFVTNITNWMTTNGYDGVDIDMEPMASTDAADYQAFITALRTSIGSTKLLTAAVEPYGFPSIFAPIQGQFNQINVMTYDMSGAWPGWCSWHNANLYQGGQFMPSTGNPMPSAEGSVNTYPSVSIIGETVRYTKCNPYRGRRMVKSVGFSHLQWSARKRRSTGKPRVKCLRTG